MVKGRVVIPLRTTHDLAAMIAEPRALLFLWVNWSIQARQSRAVVLRLIEAWNGTDHVLPCYVADVSGQEGEVWDALNEWLTNQDQPADPILYSGCGALLRVDSGRVGHHVTAPFTHNVSQLTLLFGTAPG
jgi:hypothetical protein